MAAAGDCLSVARRSSERTVNVGEAGGETSGRFHSVTPGVKADRTTGRSKRRMWRRALDASDPIGAARHQSTESALGKSRRYARASGGFEALDFNVGRTRRRRSPLGKPQRVATGLWGPRRSSKVTVATKEGSETKSWLGVAASVCSASALRPSFPKQTGHRPTRPGLADRGRPLAAHQPWLGVAAVVHSAAAPGRQPGTR